MKLRYTDAFWGKHPFDGDIILYKNKNKNKNKGTLSYQRMLLYSAPVYLRVLAISRPI